MPRGPRLTVDDMAMVRWLSARGMSAHQIAVEIGRAQSTVSYILLRQPSAEDEARMAALDAAQQREAAVVAHRQDGAVLPGAAPVLALKLPEHVQRARESLRRHMPDADATREAIRLYQRGKNEGRDTAPTVPAPVVVQKSSRPFRVGAFVHAPLSHGASK